MSHKTTTITPIAAVAPVGVMEKTTIQVSTTTRAYLRELGKLGETYDDVILRLVVAFQGSKTEP